MEFHSLVLRQRESVSRGIIRPIASRIQLLIRLKSAIQSNESSIIEGLKADLKKPEFESYAAEIGIVYEEINFALRHLRVWMKPRRVPTPLILFPSRSEIYREPLGVVLIIAPWNYPFQLAIGPLVGALAAGNAAIVKPSELAPATSAAIAKMISAAFYPSIVACVRGGVEATTQLLSERFDHIFFTGGATVGKIVMAAAAKHLTPVTLELGGKSPCIVDREVPIDRAAKRIVWGKYWNAGQTCVAPDYLLVHAAVKKPLLEQLKHYISVFFGNDPAQSPDYARIVNERHFLRLRALLKGGTAYAGGDAKRESLYIAPTILDGVRSTDPVMQEEIFGPILPVLTFETLDEAIQFVNDRPKPLALYFFSSKRAHQRQIIEGVPFGGGCINDTLTHLANPNLPFGGVGDSGMGRYHGKFGFDAFTHEKSVVQNPLWVDIPLRYSPFKGKLALIRRLMR